MLNDLIGMLNFIVIAESEMLSEMLTLSQFFSPLQKLFITRIILGKNEMRCFRQLNGAATGLDNYCLKESWISWSLVYTEHIEHCLQLHFRSQDRQPSWEMKAPLTVIGGPWLETKCPTHRNKELTICGMGTQGEKEG